MNTFSFKKIAVAGVAATLLLGSTAAYADGYRGGYERHDHGNGALVVAGVGIAALALIAASQHDRDDYHARGYYYAPNGYYYRNTGDYYRWQAYYGGSGGYDNYRRDYHRDYRQDYRGDGYRQDYRHDGYRGDGYRQDYRRDGGHRDYRDGGGHRDGGYRDGDHH